jgi:alkylation response protein AidB-like acyl-CoA dehydrogenase
MQFSPEDEEFRGRVAEWLAANVPAGLRGAGGPGREHEAFAERLAWNRQLAAAGWACLGWPEEHGGRGATLAQQVIFHEEYARSGAPARVGIVGEELLGPTLIAFGTPEQKRRFLPPIAAVEELWCQGYSEPGAGSDLAAVATTAVPDGDQWVITGQKVWTSLAHVADWCFVLARTGSASPGGRPPQTPPGTPRERRGAGLSYLLVPMRQPEITVRPIRQLTGTSEFNEVFFDGARTEIGNVVGEPGDGWRIAKATLEFERGVAMLGQQVGFRREFGELVEIARRTGAGTDPLLRDRLARAWIGLEVIRAYALDTLGEPAGSGAEASVLKVLWSRWHRALGELAMDVRGAASMIGDEQGDLDVWQRLFLFSRADTIYGGSDEIQRNIIATRALGLPRQARS